MVQAEDRAHRIGQPSSVNCYYLYAENTLDSRIYFMLQRKFRVVTSVLDGQVKKLHGNDTYKELQEVQNEILGPDEN